MTTPVLSVRDLVVEFPTRRGILTAVDRISFDIAPGEILGVVGESGAGKSMTGTAVIGLIEPPGRIASGQVLLKGERIDNLSPEAMRKIRGKRVGMVFQDPLTSLNPLYKVGEQLIETIQTHASLTTTQARQRAIDLLTEVGIPAPDKRIDAYPHQFSGGMRQRVVLALALCAEPELVIADEPTTALDVTVQAQVLDLLGELRDAEGMAMVLITHDLGVVARQADRVAVMYAGRVVETGTVEEVFRAPRHPYTISLFRSIPDIEAPAGATLAAIAGSPPDPARRPAGCAFAPRCFAATEQAGCRVERPVLRGVGHLAACHRQGEPGVAA